MLAQASAFIIWPITQAQSTTLWYVVASAILISCGWWENFAPLNTKFQKLTKFENSRYVLYAFVSLWKCAVFLASMLAIEGIRLGKFPHQMFEQFVGAFQEHNYTVQQVNILVGLLKNFI